MGFDMQWIEVNGLTLRYELSGLDNAPLLVLVHELGGTLESWEETLPGLQQHFRTLRYDQRGFGRSEKVSGSMVIEDHIADLAALLDALEIIRPVDIAGSALGAGIAAAFSAHHPQRVRRLLAKSLVTRSNPDTREHMISRAHEIERSGMRPQVDASLARSYPEILRTNRERFLSYRQRWITNDPQSFSAISRMLLDMNTDELLSQIKCPTLVLGCEHDLMRPPDTVRALAEKILGSRYQLVQSGHFMHAQTPELFVEHALEFFRN